jgi:hypothetical protein
VTSAWPINAVFSVVRDAKTWKKAVKDKKDSVLNPQGLKQKSSHFKLLASVKT